jgi:hypothetical protein
LTQKFSGWINKVFKKKENNPPKTLGEYGSVSGNDFD